MTFIDQLRQEVRIHGDMETDFRSRRYTHARAIAQKYIDAIEEAARISVRNGDYERLEHHALITGFCPIVETDFEQPFVKIERQKSFWGKRRLCYTRTDNELFDVFLSAYQQLCDEENILYYPFQAQIVDKHGQLHYQTLPLTLLHPKKEKIQAFGFPYQIEF